MLIIVSEAALMPMLLSIWSGSGFTRVAANFCSGVTHLVVYMYRLANVCSKTKFFLFLARLGPFVSHVSSGVVHTRTCVLM